MPESMERIFPGFFQYLNLSLHLGPPLKLFSRQHVLASITQAEDPLSSLETIAPSLPHGELKKLLESVQALFAERMNSLFADGKKRSVIRCLRSAESISFAASSEGQRAIPSAEKVLGLGMSDGRSGFYRKDDNTLFQGITPVRQLIPLSRMNGPALCFLEETVASLPEQSLMQECAASRHLCQRNIPFILKMWGVSYHKTREALPIRRIISEYCNEGLLFDYIRKESNLLKRMKLGLQLAHSLQQMHAQGLVHMNLLPSSILVHSEGDEVSLRLRSVSAFRDLSIPSHKTCVSLSDCFIPQEAVEKMRQQEPIPVTPALDLWQSANLFFALKHGRFPSEEALTLFPEREPFRFGYLSIHSYIGSKISSPKDPVDQAILALSSFLPEHRPSAAALADIISHWIESHS